MKVVGNVKKKSEEPRKISKAKSSKGTGKKLCPRCSAHNKRSCLELYQVTDTTAVLLCTSDQCLFRREVRRDYAVLHRLLDKQGDDEHNEKTGALKDWTFEGKRALDTFKCPMSFKEGSPEEACAVLKQTVSLLSTVVGREIFPDNAAVCVHKAGPRPGDEEDLDPVDALLRDHAEIIRHKEVCCSEHFSTRVNKELLQIESDLRQLGVNVPVYKQRIACKYSTVDTAVLFKKWLGDRFDFVERYGLPSRVVDLSSGSSVEMVPGLAGEHDVPSDPLDAWLGDTQCGEWDLNDSFAAMLQEDTQESPVLSTLQVEKTACP